MVNKIEQDHQRFRQIVRGRIRKDLRRFLSRGELLGREGKRVVSIPVHDIDIPTFRYGDNSGGVVCFGTALLAGNSNPATGSRWTCP